MFPFAVGSARVSSHVLQYSLAGFAMMYFMNLRHFPHREKALPLSARDEKETSKSWSIPEIVVTKYWNLSLNTSSVCFRTDLKLAFPRAMSSV